MAKFESINPATGTQLAEFSLISDDEMNDRLDRADRAFRDWSALNMSDRAGYLVRLSEYLQEYKHDLAVIITREMGKPLKQAVAELEKCALTCAYYARHGAEFLAPDQYDTDYSSAYVSYEPLGVIYIVMPWNFPFWQVIRCAAPAVMVGNTVVLKHAANVPECALALEGAFRKSGFPEGVFTNLFISHEQSDLVIASPVVKGVSLTGSERAGSSVASAAGKNIKRTVMELGGSDPFIVLPDADLDHAVKTGLQSRMQNAGQSCICAKRFILHKSIAEEFISKYVAAAENQKIGDPMDADTEIGPLARKDLVETLHRQVTESVSMGARVLTGGQPADREGFYYFPTVITDIPPLSPAYKDELFGPVASVFVVDNEDDAIRLANDTTFGLGASLWTRDLEKARTLATRIQSGCVYINTMVKSDPRIPFGGIKHSGYGRELSDVGIREFVNIKTICIA